MDFADAIFLLLTKCSGPLPSHSLQFLGGHAGRKRKRKRETTDNPSATQALCPPEPNSRDISATSPQQCQQPHEIHRVIQSAAFSPPSLENDEYSHPSNASSNQDKPSNSHQRDQQIFQFPQDTAFLITIPQPNVPYISIYSAVPSTPRSDISSSLVDVLSHRP